LELELVDIVSLVSTCYADMGLVRCFIDKRGRNRITWASDCCQAQLNYIVDNDSFVVTNWSGGTPHYQHDFHYVATAVASRPSVNPYFI